MRAVPHSNHLTGSVAWGLAILALSCSDGQPAPLPADEPATATTATKQPAPPAEPAPRPADAPIRAAQPAAVPATGDAGPPAAEDGVSIAELVVARGVEQRKPVDPGTSFTADGPIRLYAIFDVVNPGLVDGELTVSWLSPEGKERGAIALSFPAKPKWRTWAFHSHIESPGRWEAVVRTAGGQVLGRAPFEITFPSH